MTIVGLSSIIVYIVLGIVFDYKTERKEFNMKFISKIREKLSGHKVYRFFKRMNETVEKKIPKDTFMGIRIICSTMYICALTFCLKVGLWLASAYL